jgi:hypothetical protein
LLGYFGDSLAFCPFSYFMLPAVTAITHIPPHSAFFY